MIQNCKSFPYKSYVYKVKEDFEIMDEYQVNRDECIYCGACIDGCPVGAITRR